MKKTSVLAVLTAVVLISSFSYSQPLNNDNLISVVTPPPGFNINPPLSQPMVIETVDGFDNFYLGVDFGEPYIATNPRDILNSICAYNTNGLHLTLDGRNWVRNSPGFPGFGILGDPAMAYDSLGTFYYVQLYQNGSTYGICVVKSTNKGVNWQGPYNVIGTNVGLCDKEWVVADQTGGPYSHNVYIGWRQFGTQGDMRFVRSTNSGVNWSSPLTITGSQGAYVSVGPNGNVPGGSVYFACLNGNTILVNRSTDGGQTFLPQMTAANPSPPGVFCANRNTVKACIRTDAFPRMAVDNGYTSTRGYVYVAYAHNPAGPDLCDINLVRSTDYGLSWSSPVRVNDDATSTDQWMPSVSVDLNGKVYVCWYDSRVDPANNLLTQLYGAVSTNGGQSFVNGPISNIAMNPNNMAVGQPGGEKYMGDYIGISAMGNTSYSAWMDARDNSLGSYVGYFPDFAMTANPSFKNLGNNDSTQFIVKVPAVKGPYTGAVKFTAAFDTVPQSGSINFSFLNGRDSVTSFPDSVTLKVKTIGTVTPRLYKITITGRGTNNVPIHTRTLDLLVNSSRDTVGTNRNGYADFKVNGTTYNTQQNFVFPNGSVVTVQAISPKVLGATQYVYLNWSDNGDTTHNITVNGNMKLTANYKAQYKLIINSAVGNTFGGNVFYDSAASFTFGVLSRTFTYNGTPYQFRGWTGSGTGSYTSPDSTGNDSAVTMSMNAPVLELARWFSLIGIQGISSEIPKEYKLYQNFPNPFNPSTTINFDIIKSGDVKIVIYDILGREVKTIVNEYAEPGKYKVVFNADNFASGLYFYKITTNEFTDVKKLLIVK